MVWPHRDTIISSMLSQLKHDFPSALIIIDGTELKAQAQCALALQSQLYSDNKSHITLKCIIACDPSGSLVFVSDKAITKDSGFYTVLKTLIEHEYIKEGT